MPYGKIKSRKSGLANTEKKVRRDPSKEECDRSDPGRNEGTSKAVKKKSKP